MSATVIPQHDKEEAVDVNHLYALHRKYFFWYGIALPILVGAGILGNVFAMFVLRHPRMRSLSTVILISLLAADSLHLVSICCLITPSILLPQYYSRPDSAQFYGDLVQTQKIFMVAYPICATAHCVVVWYTLALVYEYYLTMRNPEKALLYYTSGNTGKLLITVLNLSIVMHLLYFFSLSRVPVQYDKFPHSTICLSQIYQSSSMENFEKYGYVLLAFIIPYALIIFFVLASGWLIHQERKERRRLLSANYELRKVVEVMQRSGRSVKGGRSMKLIFTIAVMFLSLEGASQAVYFSIINTIDLGHDSNMCHVTPSDRRFYHTSDEVEFLYYFFLVLYSSLKFPVILIASKDFRSSLVSIGRNLKHMCATVCSRGRIISKRTRTLFRKSIDVAMIANSMRREAREPDEKADTKASRHENSQGRTPLFYKGTVHPYTGKDRSTPIRAGVGEEGDPVKRDSILRPKRVDAPDPLDPRRRSALDNAIDQSQSRASVRHNGMVTRTRPHSTPHILHGELKLQKPFSMYRETSV